VTKRVLLVDDDGDIRDSVSGALERRGYEVYAAASVDEARAAARAWPPDAVVLDLYGAGDAERAARAFGAPVVLASGSSEAYLAAAAQRVGAAAAVAKPYGLGQLVAALEHLRPAA